MDDQIRLGLSMVTTDPAVVARVSEQFGRIAAGCAMEGVECAITVGPEFAFEDEEAA